jgi:predicted esterase
MFSCQTCAARAPLSGWAELPRNKKLILLENPPVIDLSRLLSRNEFSRSAFHRNAFHRVELARVLFCRVLFSRALMRHVADGRSDSRSAATLETAKRRPRTGPIQKGLIRKGQIAGLVVVLLLLGPLLIGHIARAESPAIQRILPPPGIELTPQDAESLESATTRLGQQLQEVAAGLSDQDRARWLPDVAIYHKAVRYALDHGEFYHPREVQRAHQLLEQGRARLEQLADGRQPWAKQHGLVVRGYRSKLDDSVQPYGLVIPENLDLDQPAPLYVWLHGRGDKNTDMNFIAQRQSSTGQIQPDDAIVLHPFGRYCNGFKSAGEIDVLEAIDAVAAQYSIDPRRIVLWGFSMGGAGAWHLGAHYADHWVVVSPGAGFAETARYTNLKPEDYPPEYEQTLWGMYDVPGYVRNLFNVPVVAYSGEKDRQIQAARVMEAAFAQKGRNLTHLIGPGMGHKYDPQTLQTIRELVAARVRVGRNPEPDCITLQTRTLRYNRCHWVEALGLKQHWHDSRIDARIVEQKVLLDTKNITQLAVTPPRGEVLIVDDVEIPLAENSGRVVLSLRDGTWQWEADANDEVATTTVTLSTSAKHPAQGRLSKRPGLQGPIDDAFLEPFLVVTPSGTSPHPQVQQWVESELEHFLARWRSLMRGDARIRRDVDVTSEDMRRYHLILWGDPASNRLIGQLASRLPIQWQEDTIRVGDAMYPSAEHVVAAVYPNLLMEEANRYVVLNSGLTFREGHDRTNSLQNPKLPDWAILGITQPPDALQAGEVKAADFFDEDWQRR